MKNHKRFCAIMLNYERFCPIMLNYERFWLLTLNHEWFCGYNAKPYKVPYSAVLNPTGSVQWMQNFQWFCRSMPNHGKLSILLDRTKKVLSKDAESWMVLLIKSWTVESSLFDYTEPKRFCPMNTEPRRVLSTNAEPWKVIYPITRNQKGSDDKHWTLKGSAY